MPSDRVPFALLCQTLGTMSKCLTRWCHSLDAYFDNMTAFHLFHYPTFESKIRQIGSRDQLWALLASMFSFSSRFIPTVNMWDGSETSSETTLPTTFQSRASQLIEKSLAECEEDSPPLSLLQALIISVFLDLAHGVRSRAWRALGLCTRIAYELRLHRIDPPWISTRQTEDVITLRHAEERR